MISRYIARRLVLLFPVLFGITLLVFAAVRFAPGDPIKLKMGEYYQDEAALAMQRLYNLDQPVPIQYGLWLSQIIRGNFGRSIFTDEPVLQMILNTAPTTLYLAVGSMLVAILISIPLGIFAATHKDTWLDNGSRVLATLGISLPVFWTGLLLIIAFAVIFPIFPPGGTVKEYGWKAIVLPSLALGAGLAALLTRITRSSMVEVLGEDYVRTAKAKGLSNNTVYYRHALRNALIPLITIIGFQFGTILGGAVLTETIFNLPGLGRLLVDSVLRRDYPVIQGGVLLIALIFVISNLVVDVLYVFVDPRISYDQDRA